MNVISNSIVMDNYSKCYEFDNVTDADQFLTKLKQQQFSVGKYFLRSQIIPVSKYWPLFIRNHIIMHKYSSNFKVKVIQY